MDARKAQPRLQRCLAYGPLRAGCERYWAERSILRQAMISLCPRHRRLTTAISRMASSAVLYIENPTRTSPPVGAFSTSTGRGA